MTFLMSLLILIFEYFVYFFYITADNYVLFLTLCHKLTANQELYLKDTSKILTTNWSVD